MELTTILLDQQIEQYIKKIFYFITKGSRKIIALYNLYKKNGPKTYLVLFSCYKVVCELLFL